MDVLPSSFKWRWGVVAGMAMMFLALYPQFRLWAHRGGAWNGAYAYNDIDEVAYSAYLQALIDGRARRNDPYTGRDLMGDIPPAESFFSIQFLTPMVIAAPSRWLGISSSTAMTIVGALCAFATTLAIFFLLGSFTVDARFAAVGALAVLCLGTLAAGEGAVLELTGRGIAYPYLPFLRRFVPALPFPFMFLFASAVGRTLSVETSQRRLIWMAVAVASFGFMVYSYFYLWTAAAAFFVCLGVWWFLAKPEGRRGFAVLATIAAGCAAITAPYLWLLSRREPAVDEMSVLVATHRPDLLRMPELIGFVILALLAIAMWRGRIRWRDPVVALAGGLAVTLPVLFNQQILTGRSLQPIHYQVFIGNYLAVLGAVLCVWLIWRGRRPAPLFANRSVLALIGCVVFGWGVVEAKYSTRVLDAANIVRDQAVPVERQLALEAATGIAGSRGVVLPLNLIQGDDQPTFAPQPVLWARHQYVFTGTSWAESKRRFFALLYYSGVSPEALDAELKNGNFVYLIALFGWGRATDRLTAEPVPLTNGELDAEVRAYTDFAALFDRKQAASPELSYVVVHAESDPDLTNLDLWYERDEGQRLGSFVLYHVRLRPGP